VGYECPNERLKYRNRGSSMEPVERPAEERIRPPNHRFSPRTVDERPWPDPVAGWHEGAAPIRKGPENIPLRRGM
jgi:hypothetical protein